MAKCITSGCKEQCPPNSELKLCPKCRAYINAALRKGSAYVYKRRQQINVLSSRYTMIEDKNVVELNSKRKQREFEQNSENKLLEITRLTRKLVRVIAKPIPEVAEARRRA